jgi:hypothetical protein
MHLRAGRWNYRRRRVRRHGVVHARLMTQHLLDLGIDDVHTDGAARKPKTKAMSDISTEQRKSLPARKFADPSERKYPVHDKAHADNAAARLEGQKASMSPGKYERIRSRIKAAQRGFGEKPKAKKMRMAHGFRLSIDHPKSGRIEVRHMTDKPIHCQSVELVALSDDAVDVKPMAWNQLARPGHYFKDGSPFTLDQRVFSEIIKNFYASENKLVPVDFEHASEQRASDGAIPALGAPAQGWIKAVEMRDGNLYGLIEWNDLAREYIKAGAYKFLSPAIRFGAKDSRSGQPIGARLTSTALTNSPFLDGMQKIAAKDTQMAEVAEAVVSLKSATRAFSAAEYMPGVRAALKLPELATAKMCSDHLGMLREHYNAAGGDMTVAPTGVKLGDYMMPMRDMLRPPMGASWDDVFDLMEDLVDQAMDEHLIRDHGLSPAAVEDDNETATASDETLDDEEMTMSDAALTVQLTEAKAQSIALTDKVKSQETEVAKLTLQLKDAESKTSDATTKIAELEKQLKTLTDERDARNAKLMSDRVDAAFETYKDSKKLTDANKKQMTLTLKQDEALFNELYPTVDASKRYLLRDVSTTGSDRGVATTTAPNEIPDMKTLTDKYAKEPGVTIEQAVAKAYTEVTARIGRHVA